MTSHTTQEGSTSKRMAGTSYQRYQNAEILNADPVRLVVILYRGAIDSVAAARRHCRNGEIRQRSRRINQAYRIVFELLRSLDFDAGGEISQNLRDLYLYIQKRLLDANRQQAEAPLAEVESLLTTLLEGWQTVPASHDSSAASVDQTDYVPINCTC
jgi:flagellar secretion chaperone FliS